MLQGAATATGHGHDQSVFTLIWYLFCQEVQSWPWISLMCYKVVLLPKVHLSWLVFVHFNIVAESVWEKSSNSQ